MTDNLIVRLYRCCVACYSKRTCIIASLVAVGLLLIFFLLPSAEPERWYGLLIEPEKRCSAYDVKDYSYSRPNLAKLIQDELGTAGWFGLYEGRILPNDSRTHIEHIVARAEAHDSGLCREAIETREAFASDLNNLTFASSGLNLQKGARDAGEWVPTKARCWFARTVIFVKQTYELSIDRAEKEELERMIQDCRSGIVPPRKRPTTE